MRIPRKTVSALFLVVGSAWNCAAQDSAGKGGAADVASQIAGAWRGNSVCLAKNSPCHDEVNVYHFLKVAGRPNSFSVTASKIVDGKEIVMGSSEWTYNAAQHSVESRSPAIRLVVTGNKMDGALSLPDGMPYRRISLKKEDPNP
jgi:hypothetical protein